MSHNIRRAAQDQIGAYVCMELYRRIGAIPSIDSPHGSDFRHPSQLVGINVPKELIDSHNYEEFTDLVNELRGVYSAGGMRCLRADSGVQKFPLLNLIRQVSKANGILLEPHSKSDGYEATGKKRLQKWFIVKSMDSGDFILQSNDNTLSTPSDNSVTDTVEQNRHMLVDAVIDIPGETGGSTSNNSVTDTVEQTEISTAEQENQQSNERIASIQVVKRRPRRHRQVKTEQTGVENSDIITGIITLPDN